MDCSSNWKKVKLLGKGAHGSVFLAKFKEEENRSIYNNNCKERSLLSCDETHLSSKFHHNNGERERRIISQQRQINQEKKNFNSKHLCHIAVKQVVLDSYLSKTYKSNRNVREGNKGLNLDEIITKIEDDGKGFSTTEVAGGNGLNNIKKRAHDLGGEATISSSPETGTKVEVTFPKPE